MLKFTDVKVVFAEIPDQITLAINISGCPCACPGCHSSYLAGDVGEPLTDRRVEELLAKHDSVSCISIMGGDGDPSEVSRVAALIKHLSPTMLVGWYSGRDELSLDIDLANFDYVKIGSYQEALGPLDSPTTNQRLYRVDGDNALQDITIRLQRSEL